MEHIRAAELLGMRKMELIELYSRLGIQYLDMTDGEFEVEIQTVKRLASMKVFIKYNSFDDTINDPCAVYGMGIYFL